MTECEHAFDHWDLKPLFPPEGHQPAGNGLQGDTVNGLPSRLEARVPCKRCGERVVVSYVIEEQS